MPIVKFSQWKNNETKSFLSIIYAVRNCYSPDLVLTRPDQQGQLQEICTEPYPSGADWSRWCGVPPNTPMAATMLTLQQHTATVSLRQTEQTLISSQSREIISVSTTHAKFYVNFDLLFVYRCFCLCQ